MGIQRRDDGYGKVNLVLSEHFRPEDDSIPLPTEAPRAAATADDRPAICLDAR